MIFKTITNDITGANKSIGLFGLSLKDVSNKIYAIQTRGFKESIFNTPTVNFDVSAIDKYNRAILNGISAQDALASASKNTNSATIALMESANGTTISTEQMTAAQQASTVAARAQSAAFKITSVALNMIAYALIAKGIQLAANAIDQYINRAKYAAEALEEAQQKINDSQDKLKEMSTLLSENKDRFLELSEGVDRFSHNLSLSEEDYAEYLSISEKIAELSPSLIAGYDEQGNILLDIGNSAEETAKKLDGLLETEQAVAQQTLIDNMDAVAEGIYYEVEEARNNIAELEAELSSLDNTNVAIDIAKTADENFGKIEYIDNGTIDDKYYERMEKSLTSAGIKFEKDGFGSTKHFQILEASPEQLENAQKFYDAALEQEKAYYSAQKAGLEKAIQEQERNISGYYTRISANLNAWVKDNYDYQYLTDSMQEAINVIIPEIDWATMGKDAPKNAFEYRDYIQKNLIDPLMAVPADSKQNIDSMFQELLAFEPGDVDVVPFAEYLQNELEKLNIHINLTPMISSEKVDYESLQNAMADAAQKATGATDGEITSKSGRYNYYQEIYDKIDEFAKAYEIDTEEEIEAFSDALDKAKGNIDKAFEDYLNRKTGEDSVVKMDNIDFLSQVQLLSKGLEQLNKIYSDVSDKGDFDWSSILNNQDFEETFGELDSYENFIETIAKFPDDIDKCQEAFNTLSGEYLSHSDILKDVTEDTKDYTIEFLKQKGYKNAEALVEQQLAARKRETALAEQFQAQTGINLNNITSEQISLVQSEINKLLEEGSISTQTAEQLSLLAFRKAWCNKNTINTSGDIKNLMSLAQSSATLTRLLSALASAKAAVETTGGMNAEAYESQITSLEKQIDDYLNGNYGNAENSVYGSSPSIASSSNASSSNTTKPTEVTQEFNWIEKYLNAFARKTEKIMNKVSDYLWTENLTGISSAIV